MSLEKRRNVIYTTQEKADYYLSSPFYQDHSELQSEPPVDLLQIKNEETETDAQNISTCSTCYPAEIETSNA